MNIEYDARADALYIALSDEPYAHGVHLDDRRRIDYAADGTIIGVELLFPSLGLDMQGLPVDADTVATLASRCRFVVHN